MKIRLNVLVNFSCWFTTYGVDPSDIPNWWRWNVGKDKELNNTNVWKDYNKNGTYPFSKLPECNQLHKLNITQCLKLLHVPNNYSYLSSLPRYLPRSNPCHYNKQTSPWLLGLVQICHQSWWTGWHMWERKEGTTSPNIVEIQTIPNEQGEM